MCDTRRIEVLPAANLDIGRRSMRHRGWDVMKSSLRAFGVLGVVAAIGVLGCSRKEAPVADGVTNSGSERMAVICSYAPSQSAVVSHVSSIAGGSAATAAAIAKAAGLSAVLHSSGTYIFTGSAGYVAGTIGAAGALPVVVVVGITAGGAGATLELVCASKNHPDLVAKVESAAERFYQRAGVTLESAASDSADAATSVVFKIEKIVENAKETVFD